MRNPAAQGRPDANHTEIVAAYEALYCNVLDLSHVGFGCPDIGIALSRRMYLREIKTTAGNLSPSQIRFANVWRGPEIKVIRTVADVENDVLLLREQISRGTR